MWEVAPGTTPTLDEAVARLEQLRRGGPSDQAFGWEALAQSQTMDDEAMCVRIK